jgi:hypothetical protein
VSSPDPGEAEPGTLTLGSTEPAISDRTALASGDPAGDWLCAWCHNRVANEKDRFRYEGQDEFTFSNPEGIRFAIITFAQTLGCREAGTPTLQYTWFPGHAGRVRPKLIVPQIRTAKLVCSDRPD